MGIKITKKESFDINNRRDLLYANQFLNKKLKMIYFFLFKKFIKARWIYKKPKHKKFILYDLAHSNYLLNYIKKENTAIYYTRGEEINFLFYIKL